MKKFFWLLLICIFLTISCKKTTEIRDYHGMKYNWSTRSGYGSYVDHTPGKIKFAIEPIENDIYVVEYVANKKEIHGVYYNADLFRFRMMLKFPDGTLKLFSSPLHKVRFVYNDTIQPNVEMYVDTMLADIWGPYHDFYQENNEIIVTVPYNGIKSRF